MLAAERVNDYVTARAPTAMCDRCITIALGYKFSGSLSSITSALGTTSDFSRSWGMCALCDEERVVIWSLAH